jgi:LuxR family maltose regulon positive regulatory protein
MTEGVDPAALGLQYGLTQAQLLLAQGHKAQAGEILGSLYTAVSQAGLVFIMIEVRLLQALAATAPVDALLFLEEALEKAQPEGLIRSFLDKGQPMTALLERLKSQGGERKAYILTLLSAYGETGAGSRSQPLVEPLSERELDVLRLVAQGLSNGEIATRLVVSVGTVKTHVHSIINKIGVSSRTQAVARARELELL